MPTSEVDLVWEEVVRALWEGKLGHTAKVSGAGPHSSGSHVICVYVDPFWEVSEVERVRRVCRFVQTQPDESRSAGQLARLAGLHARTLQRVFQRHVGLSPSEFADAEFELLAPTPG